MYGHETGPVRGLRPYLVAHVRNGWRNTAAVFRSEEGQEIDISDFLPARTRVAAMVPGLLERGPENEAEANLARYLHIIFPLDTDPDEFLDVLQELECFDEVRKPPEISLPDGIA